MTNQGAIFLLKEFKKEHTGEWDTKAFDMAIAALEKQKPIKPKEISQARGVPLYIGNCPSCGKGVVSDERCCLKCGQVLDWREDAE